MAEPSKPQVTLAPIKRTPLYKTVLARLQELVARAELAPGDRLPGERELAAQLGVSRNSLRPALAALEALGVIEIRHGSGAFLRRSTVAEVAEGLSQALLEESRDLPAVLEARVGLERFAGTLAAARRDAADLDQMDAALARMEAEIAAGGAGVEADEAFHAALVAAAHNPVLSELHDHLSAPIRRVREESLAQPGRPQRSLEAHRRIVAAIRAGDPEASAAAIDSHLSEVGDSLLLRGGGG